MCEERLTVSNGLQVQSLWFGVPMLRKFVIKLAAAVPAMLLIKNAAVHLHVAFSARNMYPKLFTTQVRRGQLRRKLKS